MESRSCFEAVDGGNRYDECVDNDDADVRRAALRERMPPSCEANDEAMIAVKW